MNHARTGTAPGQTYRYRVYPVHRPPQGPAGTGASNVATADL